MTELRIFFGMGSKMSSGEKFVATRNFSSFRPSKAAFIVLSASEKKYAYERCSGSRKTQEKKRIDSLTRSTLAISLASWWWLLGKLAVAFIAHVGYFSKTKREKVREKPGRIHGNAVADGGAGAVVRKPLGIQKCYRTDWPTDRRGKV